MNPETGHMIRLRDGEKPPAGYYPIPRDMEELFVPVYNHQQENARRRRQIERGVIKASPALQEVVSGGVSRP
jgi:hypothetical protein